jgi:putative transposase
MPSRGRVEYGGAIYHVMDRGSRLENIFLDDEDRRLFLKTLGEASKKTGWRVHSYIQMGIRAACAGIARAPIIGRRSGNL